MAFSVVDGATDRRALPGLFVSAILSSLEVPKALPRCLSGHVKEDFWSSPLWSDPKTVSDAIFGHTARGEERILAIPTGGVTPGLGVKIYI